MFALSPPLWSLLLLLILRLLYTFFYLGPHYFSSSTYEFISLPEYERLLRTTRMVRTSHFNKSNNYHPCPSLPFYNDFQTGNTLMPMNSHFWGMDDIDLDEKEVSQDMGIEIGGTWSPTECNPVHRIAIVIPFRDRNIQLKKFLVYIHNFLQLQLVSYTIYVIEQMDDLPFNRGKLFNVGYNVSIRSDPGIDCFIFHDVDLLPESLSNIYGCSHLPRHMSAVANTFRYTLLYSNLFGGATSITREIFNAVNGFSNNFYGWGGEDDDFFQRLQNKGIETIRLSPTISSYRMLPHKKEAASLTRYDLLESGKVQHGIDGLNSLKFTLLNHISGPLYTLIQVQL